MFIQVVFPKAENVETPLCYKTLKGTDLLVYSLHTANETWIIMVLKPEKEK